MSVFARLMTYGRRALVYTHRWLGIALGLLFLAWFASGLVIIYARMPALPARDVLQRLPALDVTQLRISPTDAARQAGQPVDHVRISSFLGRAVYRLGAGRAASTIFADTGETLGMLSADQAVVVVRAFFPEHARTIRHDVRLTDADQWTMDVRSQMPLHRVALGDPDDTVVYVTERSGELVMRTTASERRWAYPGAVVHWLYFAPFRRQAALWTQSVIWLSVAGCVLCIAGLIWGVSVARKAPYYGLMQWHHYTGLIFGAATLAWVFSGLLSMEPWGRSPGTAATPAQHARVMGGPLPIGTLTGARVQRAAAALGSAIGADRVKEVELLRFLGETYATADSRIVSVDRPEHGVFDRFPDDAVEDAARIAMPNTPIEDRVWLRAYDNYYYSRDGSRALPVLRVRYNDPVRTWLYFDPRRGAVVRKEERLSRIERWLYHGLHSLDFPFLYYRRPLWDVVMIALSLGGILLSATTLLPGWRRVRKRLFRTDT